MLSVSPNFNPRSYKRSDVKKVYRCIMFSLFQSTLLQEERLEMIFLNSVELIFQSTLLQEERRFRVYGITCAFKFQSTLLQEERHSSESYIGTCSIFQSTLLQEERPSISITLREISKFQSTLLQEERQQKCTIILILICNNYCIVSIKSHQHYNNYFM